MILVIGGRSSGKSEFVKSNFGITDEDIAAASDNAEKLADAKCIRDYHILIRSLCEEGKDTVKYTEDFCGKNPDCIVITDEIGSGIVPIDKAERYWREACGRASCILASHADTVIRVICGIPTVIKGKI